MGCLTFQRLGNRPHLVSENKMPKIARKQRPCKAGAYADNALGHTVGCPFRLQAVQGDFQHGAGVGSRLRVMEKWTSETRGATKIRERKRRPLCWAGTKLRETTVLRGSAGESAAMARSCLDRDEGTNERRGDKATHGVLPGPDSSGSPHLGQHGAQGDLAIPPRLPGPITCPGPAACRW